MILALLLIIPVAAGLIGWVLSRWNLAWTRWLALLAMVADFGICAALWFGAHGNIAFSGGGAWLASVRADWIPQLGVHFELAMDGLSLVMVLLTAFLGAISVVVSWATITRRVGFFHLNLMLVLAGVIGVFLALDLFLFYFFWELMLVPMYFLIDIWGHEKRHYAAIKFFIFTQASGLLMLLAIIALYFVHGRATGEYTFDYTALIGTAMTPVTAKWLMLGFFIAFAVKIPAVPFHTWLPDAHTEAPTAGSVILAGLLLKTGAYGLIRFVVPLFPRAAFEFADVGVILGVIGILYGAVLSFAQTDLKRLVAYTSISHLGFVLLGVFAWTPLSITGSVLQMVTHALSTGALFIIAGAIQDRIGTRDMRRMGGFWAHAPRMGAVTLVFAMASLGLPGLGNFVAEFLILLGSYGTHPVATIVATAGLVTSTIYALWMIQRAFYGPPREDVRPADLRLHELAVAGVMIAALVWIGLYPKSLIARTAGAVDSVRSIVSADAPESVQQGEQGASPNSTAGEAP